MAASSNIGRSPQKSSPPTRESIRPTEENIQKAFLDAATGENNNLIFFGITANSELKRMLNDYAEGKRIVYKLFDVNSFDFIEFEESDVTDGSKCEISPRSKAVKKFQSGKSRGMNKDSQVPGDKFSILVSIKWVDYIRSYCKFNDLYSLGVLSHKYDLEISRKRNINANICKEFLTATVNIFKPPIANTDFPKGYHKVSEWLKLEGTLKGGAKGSDSKGSDSKSGDSNDVKS